MRQIFIDSKTAAKEILTLSEQQRNIVLRKVADCIKEKKDMLMKANAEDLAKMDRSNPLYDRLQLTDARLEGIANDMMNVCELKAPLGEVIEARTLPNGLDLKKVRVPFGVIGIIYEARPNVTFDVFSLCFKTGNTCVLKGSKDADCSNRAIVSMIKKVLEECGVTKDCIQLLPASHEATAELLSAVGLVDLVIPRGGRRLIDFVRNNAKVPCIETGAGVVHTYFDKDGNLKIGSRIVTNAKTRRVSVCNALDCLIVHSERLGDLYSLCNEMEKMNVTLFADQRSYEALEGKYSLLEHIDEANYGTEYMDYKMSVKTVDSLEEAMAHIDRYGSGHSECIVTDNKEAALKFQTQVDAACIYVNAPTSFTDGAQFGLGAEIGISTQKLGARGPMGLAEITTYKWLIEGTGQIRK